MKPPKLSAKDMVKKLFILSYEITVDYNGTEYSLSDESTYRKYHGRIGQTVSAVLITNTYDNGNVKQYINCLGGL